MSERLERLESEAKVALKEALVLLAKGALGTANQRAAKGQRCLDEALTEKHRA